MEPDDEVLDIGFNPLREEMLHWRGQAEYAFQQLESSEKHEREIIAHLRKQEGKYKAVFDEKLELVDQLHGVKFELQQARVEVASAEAARELAEASLAKQRRIAEDLRCEVQVLAAKVTSLLHERSPLVDLEFNRCQSKATVESPSASGHAEGRGGEDEMNLAMLDDGRPFRTVVEDSECNNISNTVLNLDDFLGDQEEAMPIPAPRTPAAPPSPSSPPSRIESPQPGDRRSPSQPSKGNAWFGRRGTAEKGGEEAAASSTSSTSFRSMLNRALGTASFTSNEEELEQLLGKLAETPPTLQAVRGPIGPEVERLRRATLAAPDQGIPPAARGALWSEAVGNRLRLNEPLFNRVCTRRDRLRGGFEAATTGRGMAGGDAHGCGGASASRADRAPSAPCCGLPARTADACGADGEEISLIEANLQQIALDLNRTLATRDLMAFNQSAAGPEREVTGKHLQSNLRDVLEAFVVMRPEYGYTQGMSFIAAIMVLHMDAFRAFVCFANAVLLQPWLAACFAFDMVAIRRYFDIFDDLLLSLVPKVGNHFVEVGLQSEVVLIEWWFTLFARSLPLPVVVRLWDAFFLEGDFLLFRASLGIMLYFAEALVTRERDECIALLASRTENLEPDPFFETVQKVGLTERRLAASFAKVRSRPQVDDDGRGAMGTPPPRDGGLSARSGPREGTG